MKVFYPLFFPSYSDLKHTSIKHFSRLLRPEKLLLPSKIFIYLLYFIAENNLLVLK